MSNASRGRRKPQARILDFSEVEEKEAQGTDNGQTFGLVKPPSLDAWWHLRQMVQQNRARLSEQQLALLEAARDHAEEQIPRELYRQALAQFSDDDRTTGRLVDALTFLESAEEFVPIWGKDDQLLAVQGQGTMITGPEGVGKTTLMQQLMLARQGIGPGTLLGYPVSPARGKAMYLAMDRSAQAASSLQRMVHTTEQRSLIAEKVMVWRGALPVDILAGVHTLADFLQKQGVTEVYVDSYKDLTDGLTKDEVGSAINRAIQEVIERGIDWIGAHHQRKGGSADEKPKELQHVYGSRWLTAGLGSVLLLWGKAGDRIVDLTQLKPIKEPIDPLIVNHDHTTGRSTVTIEADPLEILRAAEGKGMSVQEFASTWFDKTVRDLDRNEIEKARRKLKSLVARKAAREEEGTRGGKAARWFAVREGVK